LAPAWFASHTFNVRQGKNHTKKSEHFFR
jgi:hypothetical protein